MEHEKFSAEFLKNYNKEIEELRVLNDIVKVIRDMFQT